MSTTSTFNPETSNCLPNGAQILRRYKTFSGWMVLTAWKNEYVAWRIDEEGNAFWGNYFNDYLAAERYFWLHVDSLDKPVL